MMSESIADQNRIERDLQQTRSRMDSRLSELQGRLSPGQIVDDLMGYFRGSEGGDFARNLMDSVRSNPLPAALTGIGLTWLMASNPHSRNDASSSDTDSSRAKASNGAVLRPWANQEELDRHLGDAERAVARQSDEADAAYRGRLDEARGRALGIARQPEDTHDSFGARVQDALARAKQSVTETAHDLRDRASDATGQLGGAAQTAGDHLSQGGQAAQRMGGNLLSTITDNPVLLGAVGLAVRALLGALVPQSSQEEAALGGMAGQARDAARDLAQGVVDRGGKVAQQALDAAGDSARAHGLTGEKSLGALADEMRSGDLTSKVKQVAQEVLGAGHEAFRTEGLGQGSGTGSAPPSETPQLTS